MRTVPDGPQGGPERKLVRSYQQGRQRERGRIDSANWALLDRRAVPLQLPVFPLWWLIATLPLLTMINRAVAIFWDLLPDFCVLDAAPLSWQCNVTAAHSFIV